MPARGCDDARLAALAAALRDGESDAYDRLYRCCRDEVHAWFAARTPKDADDLTQDVFAALPASIRGYREQGQFRAWLMGVARNKYREHIRKLGRRRTRVPLKTGMDVAVSAPRLRSETFLRTRKSQVRKLIPQLSPVEREVYELRAAGHSPATIARKRGSTESAVNTAFHRACKKLLAWVSGSGEKSRQK